MPSKQKGEFTTLKCFMSLTLWVLCCCPKAAGRVLASSHFHTAATFGIKQNAATWAREPSVPRSVPESCIIVGNKEGTWRCLFSASSLLGFLAQVVTLLLCLALVSYFTGKL